MSKSSGNIVDPFVLADKYGSDALRYYLMSDVARGQDADFDEKRLVTRYNTDLANNIGNLVNRTLNMAAKYRGEKIRATTARLNDESKQALPGQPIQVMDDAEQVVTLPPGSRELGLRDIIDKLPQLYTDLMDRSLVDLASGIAEEIATYCNRLVEKTAPWKLVEDLTQADRLNAVLYHLAESLRIIAILISPVLPKAAHGIFDQLNWKMELSGKEERFSLKDAEWGGLPDGHVVGKPVPLFPRIEP